MTPVVENFEIKKNHFSNLLFGGITLLSALALAISWNNEGNKKWIAAFGVVFFGFGWLMVSRTKIIVYQEGFEERIFGKTKKVKWQDITRLSFDMVYHGHSVEARLEIYYSGKLLWLAVKQFQRKPMQRFFEILNEQCVNAIKNDHFINQATGQMDWRNKLKML